jgi:putative two-component system response regulator
LADRRTQNERDTVLLVDDNPSNLHLLWKTLDGLGLRLLMANNGKRALDVALSQQPTLVLLDIMMPEMDGFEVCRRLKADPRCADSAVIFLSALEETGDKVRGLELGAVDYVTKPFQPQEAIARVKTHLHLKRLERDLAMRNAQLAELNDQLEQKVERRSRQLMQGRDAVIFGLAKLAEARDNETGRHLERMCRYAEILAGNLARLLPDLKDDGVQVIGTTAALHDIGKIAVPDAILNKPGRLTDAERLLMNRHPSVGGETLMEIDQRWGNDLFLQTAAQIALGHHERWDGSGYPKGLAGEEIPLCARIVALADVYDALTSRRPYKEPWTHEAARDLIIEQSGSHFDPDIVTAFLGEEAEFRRIAAQLHEEVIP